MAISVRRSPQLLSVEVLSVTELFDEIVIAGVEIVGCSAIDSRIRSGVLNQGKSMHITTRYIAPAAPLPQDHGENLPE
jgi:hypothetical protein